MFLNAHVRRWEHVANIFCVVLSPQFSHLSFWGLFIPGVGRILRAGCHERHMQTAAASQATSQSPQGHGFRDGLLWVGGMGCEGGVWCPWPSISGLWSFPLPLPRESQHETLLSQNWSCTHHAVNRAKSLYMQGSQQPPRVSLTQHTPKAVFFWRAWVDSKWSITQHWHLMGMLRFIAF